VKKAVPFSKARETSLFGSKAVGLGDAARQGLPVPPGVALSGDLVEAIASGDEKAIEKVTKAIAALSAPFAVRSSAVDEDGAAASFAGQHLTLTPHEFTLLRVFMQNEGKLLTHPSLLREVWGPRYHDESHYLHVYVSQLRRKIEPDPARPRYILTEPGAGYRLVEPES